MKNIDWKHLSGRLLALIFAPFAITITAMFMAEIMAAIHLLPKFLSDYLNDCHAGLFIFAFYVILFIATLIWYLIEIFIFHFKNKKQKRNANLILVLFFVILLISLYLIIIFQNL